MRRTRRIESLEGRWPGCCISAVHPWLGRRCCAPLTSYLRMTDCWWRPAPQPLVRQIFNTRPYASSTASFIISDSVGCGNTVCISSSSVVSRFMATT